MRIEIKYLSSQGPHIIELHREDLASMQTRFHGHGHIGVTQTTPKKSLSITGTRGEMHALAQAILDAGDVTAAEAA